MPLTVLDHPLVTHRVARLRSTECDTAEFRRVVGELSTFLAYEATRDLPTTEITEVTALGLPARCVVLADPRPIVVPILRAGLGLMDGVLVALPTAEVAVVGLKRDEETFQPVQYCAKVPDQLHGRPAIVIDPMLATGGSMVATFDLMRERGAGDLYGLSVIAAPEGAEYVASKYPDAKLFSCAMDDALNDNAYIVPGLGDAGDRLFGPA